MADRGSVNNNIDRAWSHVKGLRWQGPERDRRVLFWSHWHGPCSTCADLKKSPYQ